MKVSVRTEDTRTAIETTRPGRCVADRDGTRQPTPSLPSTFWVPRPRRASTRC